MKHEIKIGDRMVCAGYPTYIIAEIGINPNGRNCAGSFLMIRY
jgi:sialic acid synthase SpsE